MRSETVGRLPYGLLVSVTVPLLHAHLAPGDLGTWVGSVGIVLTLAATVWQVGREARFRRRAMIRAQAVSISAWSSGSEPTNSTDPREASVRSVLTIANRSDAPVYEVVVNLVLIQGAAPRMGEDWMRVSKDSGTTQLPFGKVFGAVGPGQWRMTVDPGWAVQQARPAAEIAFTDAAGNHWVRRGTGKLERLRKSPIAHFGIRGPIDYQAADPVG